MDSLTRMQFLWTAAHEVLEINPALSSFYLSQIQSDKNVNISKSLIKRFCTHYRTIFIPGVTSQVEIKTVKKKKSKKNKEHKVKRKEYQNINNGDDMDEDIPQPPCCQRNTCERLYYSLDEKNNTFQSYKYSNIVKYTCNICRKETIFNGTLTNYKLEKPSLETIDEEMEISLPNKNNNTNKTLSNVNSPTISNHSRNNSNSSTSSISTHNQNKSKKRKRNKNDLQQLLSKSNEYKKPKTYSLNDFLSNL